MSKIKTDIKTEYGLIHVENVGGYFSVIINNPKIKIGNKEFNTNSKYSWIEFSGDLKINSRKLKCDYFQYNLGYADTEPKILPNYVLRKLLKIVSDALLNKIIRNYFQEKIQEYDFALQHHKDEMKQLEGKILLEKRSLNKFRKLLAAEKVTS